MQYYLFLEVTLTISLMLPQWAYSNIRGLGFGGGRSGPMGKTGLLGSSDMMGYQTPGAGRTGNTGYLPPGMALIDGELIDMTNKLVQKVGVTGVGTQYFSWLDQNGPPVFRRRDIDYGRKFVVFPDRNYFPGDGHYIVLKKLKRTGISSRLGAIYEAFYLDLGDSINALVSNWNTQQYPVSFGPGGVRGAMRNMGMGIGMGQRMKRMSDFRPATVEDKDSVSDLSVKSNNEKVSQSETL